MNAPVKQSKAARSTPRGSALATYVASAANRTLPSEVIEAAKQALADFVGCAVGSYAESAAVATRRVATSWKAAGKARIFCGPTTTPALAALVNGTMSHCMDYDDSHTGGAGHPSGPCWSSALAIASDRGLNEKQALAGFVAGYEVMTRLGARGFNGIGRTTARKGFHPTAIFGVTGAAAVASVLFGLRENEVANALGVAATSASGLVASFGTDSKPFHPGKAAMDGILAAELAENGFEAAHHLYEIEGGLLDAIIQDRVVQVPDLDFEGNWEIFNNGYKPFACGRATHGSIQAAQSLAKQIGDRAIRRVEVKVYPNAKMLAGRAMPTTPLECKFSLAFCVALGLRGYHAVPSDFSMERLREPLISAIIPVVEVVVVPDQPQFQGNIDVWLEDGQHLKGSTKTVLGNPDNPMSWDDTYVKFSSLVDPILRSDQMNQLFDALKNFEKAGSLTRAMAIVAEENIRKA